MGMGIRGTLTILRWSWLLPMALWGTDRRRSSMRVRMRRALMTLHWSYVLSMTLWRTRR